MKNESGAPRSGSWAADPTGRHQLRYWDGDRWSDHVADEGRAGSDPLPGAGPGDAAPPATAATTGTVPAEPAAPATGRPPPLRRAWRHFRSWPRPAQALSVGLAVVLVVVAGSSAPEPAPDTTLQAAQAGAGTTSSTAPERRSTTTEPPATTTAGPPPTTPAAPVSTAAAPAVLSVTSVIDGDTLDVSDGRRVRLAQVDAPERGDCYGPESTAALGAMAAGQAVELRRPPDGPERDRYGRTLADLVVGGRSVNEALVRDGAAEWYEEFAAEDAGLAARLRRAEAEARGAGRGLWSACGPAGAASAATAAPAVPVTTAAGGRSSCHPAYPGDCIPPAPPDLNCPDIARRVRVDHSYGDPHGFDRDRDGWGCESHG